MARAELNVCLAEFDRLNEIMVCLESGIKVWQSYLADDWPTKNEQLLQKKLNSRVADLDSVNEKMVRLKNHIQKLDQKTQNI